MWEWEVGGKVVARKFAAVCFSNLQNKVGNPKVDCSLQEEQVFITGSISDQ